MVTIHDIAKLAGVSIATVSYALTNKNRVKPETKVRIKRIAEEMGYVPNPLAQGLLSKKTNILGVIIPEITNQFIATFVKQLEMAARRSHYYLLLGCSSGKVEMEREIIESFIAKRVDALIIVPGDHSKENVYNEIISYTKKQKVPLLFANFSFPGLKANYVVPNLEEGEFIITTHLLEQGYRDIQFVGGYENDYYTDARIHGFVRAHTAFGFEMTSKPISCGYHLQGAYQEIKNQLEINSCLHDAYVGINDEVAFGIYKALKEKGIRVPHDVGLVGYDDIELPTIDAIELTTMHIPIQEICEMCIEGLKTMSANEKDLFRQVIEPILIIRDSSIRKQ
jgi:LacI family transcriptional regulator